MTAWAHEGRRTPLLREDKFRSLPSSTPPYATLGNGNGGVVAAELTVQQIDQYYHVLGSIMSIAVLFWLEEYWTGPPVRIYPLRAAPQASPHYNRRDVIVDLPAFLPARTSRCFEEAD